MQIQANNEEPVMLEFTDILIEKLRQNHGVILCMVLQKLMLAYVRLADFLLIAGA